MPAHTTFQLTAAIGGRLINWYFDAITDFHMATHLATNAGLTFLTGEAISDAPGDRADTAEDFALWLDTKKGT